MVLDGVCWDCAINAVFVKGLTESPSFTGKLIAKKSNVTLVKSGFKPLHVSHFSFFKRIL